MSLIPLGIRVSGSDSMHYVKEDQIGTVSADAAAGRRPSARPLSTAVYNGPPRRRLRRES